MPKDGQEKRLTCPTRPEAFKRIPPLETALAALPCESTQTAPTVSRAAS